MGRTRSVNGRVRAISNVPLVAPLNGFTRHRPIVLLKGRVLLLPYGLVIQPGDRIQTAVDFQLDLIAEKRAVPPVAGSAQGPDVYLAMVFVRPYILLPH